jgi:acetoacetyl-CoA synthetase
MTALQYADRTLQNRVCTPQSSVSETLSVIFARVLSRATVGEDEDFFDLGGDSLRAIELVAEIQSELGPDLPMTVIYDAPTIATLAAFIESEHKPKGSPLVLLRQGKTDEPLFITHGLGGSVMELRDLAGAISTDRAIYGIEAFGLDGSADPFESVSKMAQFHVRSIRGIQPSGPYLLAGFSFGGLVAFEMAKILSREGETVAFLGLLDSFPHTRFWPVRARIASWRQLAKFTGAASTLRRLGAYHRSVLREKSPGAAAIYILDRTWRAARLSFDIFRLGAWLQRFAEFAGPDSKAPRKTAIPPAVLKVQRASDIAYRNYRPSFYEGEITFIKADGEMRIPFDARILWGDLARKITIDTVASDHQNLVRTNAAALAHLLSQCLTKAMAQRH